MWSAGDQGRDDDDEREAAAFVRQAREGPQQPASLLLSRALCRREPAVFRHNHLSHLIPSVTVMVSAIHISRRLGKHPPERRVRLFRPRRLLRVHLLLQRLDRPVRRVECLEDRVCLLDVAWGGEGVPVSPEAGDGQDRQCNLTSGVESRCLPEARLDVPLVLFQRLVAALDGSRPRLFFDWGRRRGGRRRRRSTRRSTLTGATRGTNGGLRPC